MGLLAQPLTGVRVLDLGQWMAGPTAARLLADNGAEVVHVDPPEGWRWTSEADAVLNRGKHRGTLDLDRPDDLAELHRLVAESDVVVENFEPGALERFGLDHARVRARHPSVVYLSLPGFASTDEEYGAVAAFEAVIASATGQFSDMGVNRVLRGIAASYSPLPLGSAYAGVFGAMAVGLALRARLRHGQGDYIEVPVASSLLEALAYNSMHVEDLPPRYLSRRERVITDHRERGEAMSLSYNEIQTLLDPFYRTYWCADGRPFYIVAVSHRRHPSSVLQVLGLYDDAVGAGLPMHDPYFPTSQWPEGADCTLLAHPISTRWSDWLSERIAAALATRRSDEWEEVFAQHGIPAVAHRTTAEWTQTEHATASGLLVEAEDARLGPTLQMGPVVWVEEVPGAEPLTDLGLSAGPGDSSAGWLEGITVVDLTNVVAGPTIGATLARFGARVIKVDPPEPTFDPWNTVLCGLHSNRGKESVLLDVTSELGRPALHRLLTQADVVTVNASTPQLKRLGLSGDALAQIAPQAILCHLDAWSGPAGGPWAERSGYDDLVQAATGIMARFGGGLDTPEEHAHFGTIDVLAGLAAATSTAFALYARDSTGQVTVARSSLAAAGQLISAPYLCAHDGPRPHEPSGPQARGESPTYRLYATSDGWAFLVVPPDGLRELGRVLRVDGLDAMPDEELVALLAQRLSEQTGEHWQRTLAPMGVTVQPLQTLSGQRSRHGDRDDAPWSTSSYHFTTVEKHAVGRAVTLVAPTAVRPEMARVVVPADAPKYGEHTTEILREIGFRPDEIEAMVRAGTVALSWSDDYLPS